MRVLRFRFFCRFFTEPPSIAIFLLTIARLRSSIEQQEHSLLRREGCASGGSRVHIRPRRALRAAHFAQEPWVYDCGGADASAGDWRERRDFQRGVRSAAASVALPASGTAGTDLRRPEWAELAGCGDVRAGALGFGRALGCVSGNFRGGAEQFGGGRRRADGACGGPGDQLGLFWVVGSETGTGARLHAAGYGAGIFGAGGNQRRILAAELWVGPERHRAKNVARS